MNDSQLKSALRRAVDAQDFEAADYFYDQLESMSKDAQPQTPTDDQKRAQIADGMTLQVGPIDTGVELPQWASEGLAGVGRRMSEIGTLGNHKADPEVDRLLDDSIPATVGGIATDIGAMALTGAGLKAAAVLPKIGGAVSSAGQALQAPKSLLGGMAAAGTYGAATDPDRLQSGIAGAGGQGLGYGIPKLAGKIASPMLKNGAREALDAGGTLTPGEMLGGVTQRFEDAATSVPFLGDAIQGAKTRSIEGFNKQIMDDVLAPIGRRLDDAIPAGREAIDHASATISKEYDSILSGMNVKMDGQLAQELSSLRAMADRLPAAERRKFAQVVEDQVLRPFTNDNQQKVLLGKTFKGVTSDLRKAYKGMEGKGWKEEDLSRALRSVHQSLMSAAKRQNPELAQRLSSADVAYAKLGRVVDAANYTSSEKGVFTPARMLQAIKGNTDKKTFAKGQGFNQDMVESAKGMMAQKIPDSGTTTRALINAAAFGGGAALSPMTLAGLMGSAALYTRPGQKVITPLLGSNQAWRAPLRKGLEESAPYLGLLGASSGIQLSQ